MGSIFDLDSVQIDAIMSTLCESMSSLTSATQVADRHATAHLRVSRPRKEARILEPGVGQSSSRSA